MATKNYTISDVKNLPGSQVEITLEISSDFLETNFSEALSSAIKESKIDGFREGKAPEAIVLKNLGEMSVLYEAARISVDRVYGDVLEDKKIRAIGTPNVTVTKIARKNPLGITLVTAVFPEISLPDYKKIAKEEMAKKDDEVSVTDKEVEDVIKEITHQLAMAGEEKDKTELTNEDVAKLGDYKDVADFKEKVKENLRLQKTHKNKEKKRVALAEALIKDVKVELPSLFIEDELSTLINRFKQDIAGSGIPYADYLKHIKKTEDDMRKEWRPDAEKKALLQIIIGRIAKEEKIAPDEEEIKKEVDHIMSHHKDADRFRARMYVEQVLTNEKVLQFLENQK